VAAESAGSNQCEFPTPRTWIGGASGDQGQRILAIGEFADATFWQRRSAFAAVAAFAYGQDVRGVK